MATLTEKPASGRTVIPLDPLSQLHLSCGDTHIGWIGAWEGERADCRTAGFGGLGADSAAVARASARGTGRSRVSPWGAHLGGASPLTLAP